MGNENLLTRFTNCKILFKGEIIKDDLLVRNGSILKAESLFFDERLVSDKIVDCYGYTIAPGFIETQINGALGVDFSTQVDNVNSSIEKVAKYLLTQGVTSFCPTIVTSPENIYHKILSQIEPTVGGARGASVLGLHLEGPFISSEKKGAHPEEYIKEFENGIEDLYNVYNNMDNVRIVTLAPELVNASDIIQELVNRGIVVSLGHSAANLQEGEEAVHAGASYITHLFNGMVPFHHRDPGLIGLLTSKNITQPLYFGMIADGIHTHPSALSMAHKALPDGIILVTDAMAATGLTTGLHRIGQMSVEVKGRRASLAGTQTLSGSVAKMDQCVQYFYKTTKCTKVQALQAASLHPAQLLGISDHKGTLNPGSDADFILLDDKLNVKSTYIAGECVFKNDLPVSDLNIEQLEI